MKELVDSPHDTNEWTLSPGKIILVRTNFYGWSCTYRVGEESRDLIGLADL